MQQIDVPPPLKVFITETRREISSDDDDHNVNILKWQKHPQKAIEQEIVVTWRNLHLWNNQNAKCTNSAPDGQ